jgi:tryptophan synthase beta chain
VGILHGNKSFVLQDVEGQIHNAHSISAGLDYPGVGPEHAAWARSGRVEYVNITDEEALQAFDDLTRLEGIIPALESSHALAEARKQAVRLGRDAILVVNVSGRGDKDLDTVLALRKEKRA